MKHKIADSTQIPKKLVIVGDGSCGKTSLLLKFCKQEFQQTYTPTIFESYPTTIATERGIQEISLWDTAGQEDYDRIRPLSYAGSDVVLIAFSIENATSMENVLEKWYHEIKHYCPTAPIILVGLKSDLRNDVNLISRLKETAKELVSPLKGMETAAKIGAFKYVECSALTGKGVKEVFEQAMRAITQKSDKFLLFPPKSLRCCSVM